MNTPIVLISKQERSRAECVLEKYNVGTLQAPSKVKHEVKNEDSDTSCKEIEVEEASSSARTKWWHWHRIGTLRSGNDIVHSIRTRDSRLVVEDHFEPPSKRRRGSIHIFPKMVSSDGLHSTTRHSEDVYLKTKVSTKDLKSLIKRERTDCKSVISNSKEGVVHNVSKWLHVQETTNADDMALKQKVAFEEERNDIPKYFCSRTSIWHFKTDESSAEPFVLISSSDMSAAKQVLSQQAPPEKQELVSSLTSDKMAGNETDKRLPKPALQKLVSRCMNVQQAKPGLKKLKNLLMNKLMNSQKLSPTSAATVSQDASKTMPSLTGNCFQARDATSVPLSTLNHSHCDLPVTRPSCSSISPESSQNSEKDVLSVEVGKVKVEPASCPTPPATSKPLLSYADLLTTCVVEDEVQSKVVRRVSHDDSKNSVENLGLSVASGGNNGTKSMDDKLATLSDEEDRVSDSSSTFSDRQVSTLMPPDLVPSSPIANCSMPLGDESQENSINAIGAKEATDSNIQLQIADVYSLSNVRPESWNSSVSVGSTVKEEPPDEDSGPLVTIRQSALKTGKVLLKVTTTFRRSSTGTQAPMRDKETIAAGSLQQIDTVFPAAGQVVSAQEKPVTVKQEVVAEDVPETLTRLSSVNTESLSDGDSGYSNSAEEPYVDLSSVSVAEMQKAIAKRLSSTIPRNSPLVPIRNDLAATPHRASNSNALDCSIRSDGISLQPATSNQQPSTSGGVAQSTSVATFQAPSPTYAHQVSKDILPLDEHSSYQQPVSRRENPHVAASSIATATLSTSAPLVDSVRSFNERMDASCKPSIGPRPSNNNHHANFALSAPQPESRQHIAHNYYNKPCYTPTGGTERISSNTTTLVDSRQVLSTRTTERFQTSSLEKTEPIPKNTYPNRVSNQVANMSLSVPGARTISNTLPSSSTSVQQTTTQAVPSPIIRCGARVWQGNVIGNENVISLPPKCVTPLLLTRQDSVYRISKLSQSTSRRQDNGISRRTIQGEACSNLSTMQWNTNFLREYLKRTTKNNAEYIQYVRDYFHRTKNSQSSSNYSSDKALVDKSRHSTGNSNGSSGDKGQKLTGYSSISSYSSVGSRTDMSTGRQQLNQHSYVQNNLPSVSQPPHRTDGNYGQPSVPSATSVSWHQTSTNDDPYVRNDSIPSTRGYNYSTNRNYAQPSDTVATKTTSMSAVPATEWQLHKNPESHHHVNSVSLSGRCPDRNYVQASQASATVSHSMPAASSVEWTQQYNKAINSSMNSVPISSYPINQSYVTASHRKAATDSVTGGVRPETTDPQIMLSNTQLPERLYARATSEPHTHHSSSRSTDGYMPLSSGYRTSSSVMLGSSSTNNVTRPTPEFLPISNHHGDRGPPATVAAAMTATENCMINDTLMQNIGLNVRALTNVKEQNQSGKCPAGMANMNQGIVGKWQNGEVQKSKLTEKQNVANVVRTAAELNSTAWDERMSSVIVHSSVTTSTTIMQLSSASGPLEVLRDAVPPARPNVLTSVPTSSVHAHAQATSTTSSRSIVAATSSSLLRSMNASRTSSDLTSSAESHGGAMPYAVHSEPVSATLRSANGSSVSAKSTSSAQSVISEPVQYVNLQCTTASALDDSSLSALRSESNNRSWDVSRDNTQHGSLLSEAVNESQSANKNASSAEPNLVISDVFNLTTLQSASFGSQKPVEAMLNTCGIQKPVEIASTSSENQNLPVSESLLVCVTCKETYRKLDDFNNHMEACHGQTEKQKKMMCERVAAKSLRESSKKPTGLETGSDLSSSSSLLSLDDINKGHTNSSGTSYRNDVISSVPSSSNDTAGAQESGSDDEDLKSYLY